MGAFTPEQREIVRQALAGYEAMCEQHAADVRHGAEMGCRQSQRDLPWISRWERTYWDDVAFELQMRLGLDDDELQQLVDSLTD